MRVTVVFLSGTRSGTTVDLPETEASIGRSPDCTIQFDPADTVVSGHHAALVRRDGRVFVRDTHSRNGTFVDGRRVADAAEVQPGQVVAFGQHGPSVRVEFAGAPPVPPTAEIVTGAGSGLTRLYQAARQQSAAAAHGEPSQTAVIKTFVRLAQEQSSRRFKILLGVTAAAGVLAAAAIFFASERRAAGLRTELTLVAQELANEGKARAAVEQQLGQLTSTASEWQKAAASLEKNLQTSQAEIDGQRRQLDEQRRAVQSDGRFGPTVTERFASGVGLIQVRIGWHHPTLGWLRLRGTPDGKISFTTAERDALAILTVSHCTGFLIDDAGFVLTNRHCLDWGYPDASSIDDDALELKGSAGSFTFKPAIASARVSFPPGKIFPVDGTSLVVSQEHDVGLFRTSTRPVGVPVLPMAQGQQQRVIAGEDVVMLAYPGGADVTAQRRGLGSFVDSSLRDQVSKAEDAAIDSFVTAAGASSYLESIGPLPKEPDKLRALLASNVALRVLRGTMFAVRSEAMFDTLARAGQVQPDVSSRMSVSGVRPSSISYHTLSGIGGSSGAPVISTRLVVVGVNHAGFAEQDRGKQFQQSEAVPIEFAWKFLPRGVKRQ